MAIFHFCKGGRRYRTAFALSAVMLLSSAAQAFASQLTYYVATNGNDSWTGRLKAPNKNHSDGPFSTIERAQTAVRAANRDQSIAVEIRGGTYELKSPLQVTPEDSGTPTSPIVYEAYRGEQPIISGGTTITGWHINALGQWEAHLPDVKSGAWNFTELFVNGQRRQRPRVPATGYYNVAPGGTPTPAPNGQIYSELKFNPTEISGSWQNSSDIEVFAFHIWGMARMHISNVDESNHVLRLDSTLPANEPDWGKFLIGNRYIIENVKEALKIPGQWYLDRSSGVLTYIPLPGETPENTTVVAPVLSQIVRINGALANHSWVHDMTFRGISFEYANWLNAPGGHDFDQADVDLPGAISEVGARNCQFVNCKVSHVATYGISLGVGCQYNTIDSCTVSDIGAGGIKIGDSSPSGDGYNSSDVEMDTTHNTIQQCDIYGGGRMFPAGVGVYIANCPANTVTHNLIHNFYYTGVSLGWVWGYGDSKATDNVISDNDIFQIGQGVLSDMGGIYSVGARKGTIEEHNRIHDIRSFSYGGWGIYFDEGSSDVIAKNNLVYDTSAAGFHQHYGANNLLTNNIFAFGTESQLMRTRAEDHLSFTLEHNIVLSGGPQMLGSNWSGNQFTLDYNDYFVLNGKQATFNNMTFYRWQQTGQDTHSILADPGFRDASHLDFHIDHRSSADQVGFKIFDVDHFGPAKAFVEPVLPDAFPTTQPNYIQ